jgi:hypothetical protein
MADFVVSIWVLGEEVSHAKSMNPSTINHQAAQRMTKAILFLAKKIVYWAVSASQNQLRLHVMA